MIHKLMTELKPKPRGRNGGRKSSWRSPTKMIRLPERYEFELIEYARRLDSEAELTLYDQVQREINHVLMSLKPSDRAGANRLFKKLLLRLGVLELPGIGKDETRIQTRLL